MIKSFFNDSPQNADRWFIVKGGLNISSFFIVAESVPINIYSYVK